MRGIISLDTTNQGEETATHREIIGAENDSNQAHQSEVDWLVQSNHRSIEGRPERAVEASSGPNRLEQAIRLEEGLS